MSEFQTTPPIERVPIRIPVSVPTLTFSQSFSAIHTVAAQMASAKGFYFQQSPVTVAPTTPIIGSFVTFEQTVLKAIKSSGDVTTVKNHVLQAFAGQPIFASNTAAISQQLEILLSAPTVASAQPAVRAMLSEIKQQHTIIKQQRLAEVVKAACQNLKFQNVEVVTTSAGVIKVNASNLPGYASAFVFAHEVKADDKGEVRLASETKCLEDGTCKLIMEQFNSEMEKLGVPLNDTRRTPRVPIRTGAKRENVTLPQNRQGTKEKVKA